MRNRQIRERLSYCRVGGMDVARLDREGTARLMRDIITGEAGDFDAPVFMTSSNGQVLSSYARSAETRALYDQADVISADGQPMVTLSRRLSQAPLPGRVSTTDLYHDVSRAVPRGTRYFLFGARPAEVEAAVAATERLYPHIEIAGYSHGYLSPAEEEHLLERLEALRPDILWIGLGVPRQQAFVVRHMDRLSGVKIVKTAGGLFDFLSGARSRAPMWMQDAGLEWVYRLMLEPRRLFKRYMLTNPHSLYLLLTRTQ